MLFDVKNLKSMPRRLAFWVYHAPLLNRSRIGRKFIGRAFGNMRYVFDRRTLQSVIGAAGFQILEIRSLPPRLLAYDNAFKDSQGVRGSAWRALNWVDGILDERAWLEAICKKDRNKD